MGSDESSQENLICIGNLHRICCSCSFLKTLSSYVFLQSTHKRSIPFLVCTVCTLIYTHKNCPPPCCKPA
uniref:Uncharacterized protein n=1 Tax=Anguilla anguilla TaxID=7936 RepID=A0A0E9SGS7_ANGAN